MILEATYDHQTVVLFVIECLTGHQLEPLLAFLNFDEVYLRIAQRPLRLVRQRGLRSGQQPLLLLLCGEADLARVCVLVMVHVDHGHRCRRFAMHSRHLLLLSANFHWLTNAWLGDVQLIGHIIFSAMSCMLVYVL